jgi:molybdenum cofactor synthesis domain-containing protein
VVSAGRVIDPPLLAALAAFGLTRVAVRRRARVAAIITGNEVHDVETAVQPWQIRDSNGPALTALFAPLAWVEWLGCQHAPDDPATMIDQVRQVLPRVDALLLTGGVSMGDHDHVPAVLADAGCRTIFHRLPIRPGKPVLGAVGPQGQAVLGLPGNPVSVMITARRIAAAALRRRAGMAVLDEPTGVVTLTNLPTKAISLHLSLPVELVGDGQATLVTSRGSGDIVAAARSDGFVTLPPNASGAGPWPFYRWSMQP